MFVWGGGVCFKRDEQNIVKLGTILLGLLIHQNAKLYMKMKELYIKMKARKIASVKIGPIGGYSGGCADEGVCFT